MFCQRGILPLYLAVAVLVLGCKPKSDDPVRSAEIFLELADSASQEQFRNLYDVIAQRVCADDQKVMAEKTTLFLEALPPNIGEQLGLSASDLITGMMLPRNLDLEKGQLVSMDGNRARVEFPTGSNIKQAHTLAMTMVYEDNLWRACGLVRDEKRP